MISAGPKLRNMVTSWSSARSLRSYAVNLLDPRLRGALELGQPVGELAQAVGGRAQLGGEGLGLAPQTAADWAAASRSLRFAQMAANRK